MANLKPYFVKKYTACHKKKNYMAKAMGCVMALKAEEEVAVEVVFATAEIIQQVTEAQFKKFEEVLLKNMEMMAKLMREQAAALALAPNAGGAPKPPMQLQIHSL